MNLIKLIPDSFRAKVGNGNSIRAGFIEGAFEND
jgi:hypothetical protein